MSRAPSPEPRGGRRRRRARAGRVAPSDGGLFPIGGRRPALEAIRAGRAVEVLAVRGSTRTEGLRDLLAAAERAGVPVRWVDRTAIDGLGVDDHQGVAAVVTSSPELDEAALRSFPFEPDGLVRESCDLLVAIPMAGRTASLNASAALSVALFAYATPPDRPDRAVTMPSAGVAQPGSASDL